ncbi:hypothetical protein Micbo1qcDRAFT_210130 [Microdochium bolleyi]|uniref:Probable endonuclease LCL3 n=1 Tax=Microdochium bolleyi TaxID=196109 RepID=A0A136IK27_9PEZI|nr:hypothetical protein Micbo1qcDRAFT_210130 [Microdochium bolleyi]
MAYTLLLGRFVIRYPDLPNQGPEPDGDTITFNPDDQDVIKGLPRSSRPPKFSGRGNIGIRLEAIDALETHFPKGPTWHQEKQGGEKARDELLHRLGFRDVVFRNHKILSASHDELPGYVLANSIDPNGRVIGFIFAGGTALDDAEVAPPLGAHGDSVTLDGELADRSVNSGLLAEGLVYPAFYGTLPPPLRTHLAAQSRAARQSNLGLWPRSTADPNGPARGVTKETIEDLVIWPKLFRRAVAYFNEGNTNFDGFKAWLRKQARGGDDDEILILEEEGDGEGSGGRLANLHDVVAASGTSLQLQVWPDAIVIEPKRGES